MRIRSKLPKCGGITTLTSLAEPTDKLNYQDLSRAQKRAVDIVRDNKDLYERFGITLKHGLIIVGSWGSGKSQVLITMKKMGLVGSIQERGELYRWVTKDVELKRESTTKRLLENITELAKKSETPFVALDNPDIPLGSNVTEEAAYNFTLRLLEEATFGGLPYVVVALNEFTYKKLSEEKKRSMAKIAQHFDIIKLEWSTEDLERAIKTRLPNNLFKNGGVLTKAVAEVARTPRSAIFLFVRSLRGVKPGSEARKILFEFVIENGVKNAFNEYVKMLSQSGYKLSKAKSKRWIEVWRTVIERKDSRSLVIKLVERKGAESRELTNTLGLGGGYKVAHWPITAARKYHIIERPEPLVYRFTDEFLAASTEYAAGMGETAIEILENMAELYGKIGR